MHRLSFTHSNTTEPIMSDSLYDIEATDISGKTSKLADYKGQVLLVVNTASKCGFTPQYKDLEALQQQFSEKGFNVLGFPCNQFGAQEPGDEADIREFCTSNFGVSFPMFTKVDVNGDQAHPLFKHLKSEAPGVLGTERIKWNFTKFLVDSNGKVVERYAPTTKPKDIAGDIETLLSEK